MNPILRHPAVNGICISLYSAFYALIFIITFRPLYFFCLMPIIVLAADADDTPGLVLLGAFFDLFPIGAAVAAVLERTLGQ